MTDMPLTGSTISWKPLEDSFGAEVVDIDLNASLSPSVMAELRDLYKKRYLLLFRDQDLDYETQRRFCSMFGEILPLAGDAKYISTVHDIQGNPIDKRKIDSTVEEFHSDYTMMQTLPVRGIGLYAEDVSDSAAEATRFANARKGYLNLRESARAELSNRRIAFVAANASSAEERKRQIENLRTRAFGEIKREIAVWTEHPLFLTAESGEMVLFYERLYAHSILGMSAEESRDWFTQFDEALFQEDNIYTHRWQQSDFLIWDNFALKHAKEPSNSNTGSVARRVLRRSSWGRKGSAELLLEERRKRREAGFAATGDQIMPQPSAG